MSAIDQLDPFEVWPWQSNPADESSTQEYNVIGIELIQRLALKPLDNAAPAPKKALLLRAKSNVFHIGRIPSSEVHLRRVIEGEGANDAADNCTYYNCGVMSRRHAKITFSDSGSPYLIDTESHHGVFIRRADREPFKLEPKLPYLIFNGDLVTFGRSVTKAGKIHEPVTVQVVLLKGPDMLNDPKSSILSTPNITGRYGLNRIDVDEEEEEDGKQSTEMVARRPSTPAVSPFSSKWPFDSHPLISNASDPIVVPDSPSPPPASQLLPSSEIVPTPTGYILVEDSPSPEESAEGDGSASNNQPVQDAQETADDDLLQRVLAHQFIASLVEPPSPVDSTPSTPASTPRDGTRHISFTEMLHATAPPDPTFSLPVQVPIPDIGDSDVKALKESLSKIELEVSKLQKSRKRARARVSRVAQQGEFRMDSLEERIDDVSRANQMMQAKVSEVTAEDFAALQKQVMDLEATVHPLVEQMGTMERDEDGLRTEIGHLAASVDEANHDLADAREDVKDMLSELHECRDRAEEELSSLMESFKATRSKALAAMEETAVDVPHSLKRKRSESDLDEPTPPPTELPAAPVVSQVVTTERLPFAKRIRRDLAVAGAVGFIVWAGLSSVSLVD